MRHSVEKDWTTAAGFRAVVVMTDMGHRCGYVGLPEGHPLHGVGYSERCPALRPLATTDSLGARGVFTALSAAFKEPDELNTPEFVFDVHGSLTFAKGSKDYPAPSDGLWWFGFDAAHCDDDRNNGGRPLDYMVDQCESLARQIAEKCAIEQAREA